MIDRLNKFGVKQGTINPDIIDHIGSVTLVNYLDKDGKRVGIAPAINANGKYLGFHVCAHEKEPAE